MPFNFGEIGFSQSILMLFKLLLIIGGGFYVIFAFIVIRQITVMKKTLITVLEPEIFILGWLHLLAAIGLFVYFILAL